MRKIAALAVIGVLLVGCGSADPTKTGTKSGTAFVTCFSQGHSGAQATVAVADGQFAAWTGGQAGSFQGTPCAKVAPTKPLNTKEKAAAQTVYGRYQAQLQAQAAERARQAEAAKKAAAQARYEKCQSNIGGLLTAEESLQSHLGVGLNYHDYGMAVGDVRTAYDQVDSSSLAPECLAIGVKLEDAVNEYQKGAKTWDDCFGNFSCSTYSIDPELQKHWSKATTDIALAKTELEALKDPNNSVSGLGSTSSA